MQIKALASGSNGNCILVRSGETSVLIDAGISAKRITQELLKAGVTADELSCILLTHEHSDHISGLPVFLKHHPMPVFAGEGTIREIEEKYPEMNFDGFSSVEPYKPFAIGSLTVLPIRTFHDARDPLAYRLESDAEALAVMTDTGSCSDEMIDALRGLKALLLESNHDVRMVEAGSYPYPLKRRILGDFGHLSNELAGEVLTKVLNPSLKLVLLGHISEENNLPELAKMTVDNALTDLPEGAVPADMQVIPLSRYEASALFTV